MTADAQAPIGVVVPAARLPAMERSIVLAATIVLGVIALAIGHSLAYGLLALAGLTAVAVMFFAPRLGFYAMLFSLTGWPYYVGIDIGRDIPLPAVLFIVAGVWGFVVLQQLLRVLPPLDRPASVRWIEWSLVGLLLVLVVSIFLSGQPAKGVQPLIRVAIVPMMLFMICRHFMRDADVARRALDVLLLGGVIGACYALYEWFLGQNPLLERFAPPEGDMAQHGYWTATQAASGITLYRSHGFGLNPIFYATTLSMLLIHAATRFATSRRMTTTLVFIGAGLLSLAGLGSTFSRGPILACGAGLAICAFAYPNLRKYILLAIAAVATYALYDLLRADSVLAERIRDTDNITLRFKLWQTGYAMFRDYPIFGVGLGQFPEHQFEVIRRHGIGPFFEMGDGRLETVKTAEHGVLQFLAETGLVGGIAAASVIAGVVWLYVPAMLNRVAEPARALIVTAGSALIVFLLVGFTVTIYNSWEAGCLVPVMLAVLCAASTRRTGSVSR